MAATDKQKAEEILRKRRLAAKGLADKPENKENDPTADVTREDEGGVRAAVAASALRRSG
jgi:hypothetical protein